MEFDTHPKNSHPCNAVMNAVSRSRLCLDFLIADLAFLMFGACARRPAVFMS